MISKKAVGFLLLVILCIGFLLHGHDIYSIGNGLLVGNHLFVASYLGIGYFYFLLIADIYFGSGEQQLFEKSLPIRPFVRLLSRTLTLLLCQLPLLILGLITTISAVSSIRTMIFVLPILIVANLFLMAFSYWFYCLFQKLPSIKCKASNIKSKTFYLLLLNLVLFLRRFRSSYIRDLALMSLIILVYFGLSWYRDPEATNFMYFVFSCLLVSAGRYIKLFLEMECESSQLYFKTLPLIDKQKSKSQFLAAVILILPVAIGYLAIAQNIARFFILFLSGTIFMGTNMLIPKCAAFLNFSITVIIFASVRYSI